MLVTGGNGNGGGKNTEILVEGAETWISLEGGDLLYPTLGLRLVSLDNSIFATGW